MNKTVIINLSGIIFHIDEDAYLKLSSYLTTIKGYFSESEGRDEIMADIENRIAEMLSEKVSDRKQVVLMTDVDYVIGVMGKPEDFAGDKAHSEETKKEQPTYSSSGKRKRVFRDTDNKILGGVCSGIGNYFNIDPLWLRLALVVCFFSFGIGFLLYIVLWIVIPEAKTSAEKLEMHGEDINVSNIGKKVEEEMKHFGKKVGSWGEEVKKTATSSKGRDFVDRLVDFLTSVFGAFFKVFAKLLGVFFVIFGLILLVAIISSLFGGTGMIHIDNHSFSFHDFFYTFYESGDQMTLASIAIVLFLGVPLIMLVYGGVKMLLGIRARNRIVNLSAGILWVIGIALMITMGIQVAQQFSEEAESKQEFTMTKTKCDTLFLRVREVKDWNDNARDYSHKKHFHVSFRKHRLFSSDSSNIYFGYPTLDIVKSESDSMEIVVYNNAMGKDKKEALHFACNVNYEIFQKDSLIELMPYFSIPREEKWRNQQVHIEVRIPKGKTVYLAKNMSDILDDVHNETDTYDGDMVGRRWMMGSEELKCLDCNGLETVHKKKWKNKIEKEISDSIEEEISNSIDKK
ncbi:MAG: PspC domain-containing protein [Bacteroidetes bacterium]|nr:PspC domain-containing protein [Bacteroidota bacterium]